MPPKAYKAATHLRRADDIACLIRSQREALGLTQQALADRLAVSRKWVNEIEQGNSTAKLGLVLRALNELGVDLLARPEVIGHGVSERPRWPAASILMRSPTWACNTNDGVDEYYLED